MGILRVGFGSGQKKPGVFSSGPCPTRPGGRAVKLSPHPTRQPVGSGRVRVGSGRAYVKCRVSSGFGSKFLARARPVSHTGSKILTRARPSNSSGRVGSGYFRAGWVGSVGSGSPCPGLVACAGGSSAGGAGRLNGVCVATRRRGRRGRGEATARQRHGQASTWRVPVLRERVRYGRRKRKGDIDEWNRELGIGYSGQRKDFRELEFRFRFFSSTTKKSFENFYRVIYLVNFFSGRYNKEQIF